MNLRTIGGVAVLTGVVGLMYYAGLPENTNSIKMGNLGCDGTLKYNTFKYLIIPDERRIFSLNEYEHRLEVRAGDNKTIYFDGHGLNPIDGYVDYVIEKIADDFEEYDNTHGELMFEATQELKKTREKLEAERNGLESCFE